MIRSILFLLLFLLTTGFDFSADRITDDGKITDCEAEQMGEGTRISGREWREGMCGYWDTIISYYEDDGLYMDGKWSQHNQNAIEMLNCEGILKRAEELIQKYGSE